MELMAGEIAGISTFLLYQTPVQYRWKVGLAQVGSGSGQETLAERGLWHTRSSLTCRVDETGLPEPETREGRRSDRPIQGDPRLKTVQEL
jgi:hypothetical protein